MFRGAEIITNPNHLTKPKMDIYFSDFLVDKLLNFALREKRQFVAGFAILLVPIPSKQI